MTRVDLIFDVNMLSSIRVIIEKYDVNFYMLFRGGIGLENALVF